MRPPRRQRADPTEQSCCSVKELRSWAGGHEEPVRGMFDCPEAAETVLPVTEAPAGKSGSCAVSGQVFLSLYTNSRREKSITTFTKADAIHM